MKKIWNSYILASLLSALGVMVFMAVSKTVLFADGSRWLYTILTESWFHQDSQHFRYSTFILQFPSVLALQLDGSLASKNLAVYRYSFMYIFHPLAGLLLSYFILKRFRRIELLIYPLLSVATVVMSSLFFGVSVAAESQTYFWPLLFLILLPEQKNFDYLFIFLLTIVLTFSYEISLLLLLLLSFVNLTQKKGTKTKVFNGMILFLGVIANLLIFKSLLTSHNKFGFWSSFYESFSGNVNLQLLMAVGFLFFCFTVLPQKAKKRSFPIFCVFAVSFLVIAIWALHRMYVDDLMWRAFRSRTLVVPVVFSIALMMLLMEGVIKFGKRNICLSTESRSLLLFCCMVLLNFGTYHNYLLTQRWRIGILNLESVIDQNDGCTYLDRAEYEKRLMIYGLEDWALPHISTVQSKKLQIKTLLFVALRQDGVIFDHNPCSHYSSGVFTNIDSALGNFTFTVYPDRKGLFDFSTVIQSLEKY